VTSEADIRAVVELAIARHGRIDAVVNHTGHPPIGAIRWRWMMPPGSWVTIW
jgi:NAD(P)-dependent dehydrogenase (short-subunit alcohol dehydrogenase family)